MNLPDTHNCDITSLHYERDVVSLEFDVVSLERDVVSLERDVVSLEGDVVSSERDVVGNVIMKQTACHMAYASRSVSIAEANYAITNLETLAVVSAITHFRYYVYGYNVTVTADHAAVSGRHLIMIISS